MRAPADDDSHISRSKSRDRKYEAYRQEKTTKPSGYWFNYDNSFFLISSLLLFLYVLSLVPFSRSRHEHVKAVDVLEYWYMCAGNNDEFEYRK